jgi:O-methyltransferase
MIKKLILKLFEKSNVVRGPLNLNDRQGALHRAWGHVFSNHLAGDYVEFGVYQGDSFIKAHKEYMNFYKWLKDQTNSSEEWRRIVADKFISKKVNFHGLDTFAGMPDNEEDNPTFGAGTFISDFDEVHNKCVQAGMHSFFLYKGLFKESHNELKSKISKQVAIVNIDGDIYESAKDSFEMIEPYLQVGTVLLLDDYNAFNADNTRGERKAMAEFSLRSDFVFEKWFSYHYVGQAFLCVGKK